jgi:hypothetical protein
MASGPTWRPPPEPTTSSWFTKVYSNPSLPDLSPGVENESRPPFVSTGEPHPVWMTNQHLSPLVRPADVAVYVSSDTERDLEDLAVHLAVQETETLHAIIVVGPWCPDDSRLRSVHQCLIGCVSNHRRGIFLEAQSVVNVSQGTDFGLAPIHEVGADQ